MTTHHADVVVVGSGVAGLAAALELVREEGDLRVLVLTRGALGGQSASSLAQGGVAAALGPSDSPALHARDTELAGNGLARPDLVRTLTHEGPERVRELIRMGVRFDRTQSGEISLGLEGAHSRHRVLHARGDRTGAEVTRALTSAVRAAPRIRVLEQMEALELERRGDGVQGLLARHRGEESLHHIRAPAILLATGGPGRAFLRTTSPPGLDGDGLAMAARAGARLADLEFVQFHPTALDTRADPLPLVTEALRGAGARLVDAAGRSVVDPHDGGDLATRDRVARSLWLRIRAGTSVFLDAREALGDRIADAFPGVYALCRRHGVDPRSQPIPVTPAAHYHMGGIEVDGEGRSRVPGLWAVGEVAASGLHGANRLASNSLLEGLVFGPRAARSMLEAFATLAPPSHSPPERVRSDALRAEDFARPLPPDKVLRIRTLLWDRVGVVREESGLVSALEELDAMEGELPKAVPLPSRNLLLVARLITRAALLREESLGSHFRSDFPNRHAGVPRRSFQTLSPEGVQDGSAFPSTSASPALISSH